jgi:hypothetical protein
MLIVLVGATLFLAAACGGDDDSATSGASGYTSEVRANFMSTCAPQADENTCGCVFDKIKETIPFDEFKKLDQGGFSSQSELPDDFMNAITECATASLGAP